jgi:ornithine cyclodeaminase
MSVSIRLLNAEAVRELLPVERCIPLMREAMVLVAQNKTRQPIRQFMNQPDGRGLLGLMPGHIGKPEWLGIKVITVFPGNFGTEFGSHQGMVLLFDTRNGAPKAIVDAREITAIRTAAATAVATDVLAPKDVRSLALFGYGEQARTHAMALMQVRRFEEIIVWGRDIERARSLIAELQGKLNCSMRAVAQAEQAAGADVVCTLTAAAEPFYRAAWLRPGQHLNLVGSGVPSTSEVEPEVVQRSRYFTDYKESALVLAGDFIRAKQAGLVDDDHILGSIGDVLEGKIAGRKGASDITVFKSLGMVAEDLISADFVQAEAERRGLGQVIDW